MQTAQISKPWSITTTYEDPEVVWDRYADLHIERWSFYSKIRAEMGDPELTLQVGKETKPYRHNELIGSPEQIVEKLQEVREKLPFTRLVTDATAGIPVREVTYPSLKLFADRARLPFLVISPYARKNFVDSTLTDQSSVVRFIEDNWELPQIGNGSFDEVAGSILNMFDFSLKTDRRVFLDPLTGLVVAEQSGGN
jgi:hypothetical protein